MLTDRGPLTYKKIFIFWTPLAATWLMMSTEGPFLAAVIARLTEPKYNLAAYGVAYSFAVLLEAPIIMIMSASTALVKDWDSYIKLRNFTFVLNGMITALMAVFVIPPVFSFITLDLVGLPDTVAALTHRACLILLPWPAAIGYRRFYQGILICSHLTRRVAYGTIIRITSMAATATVCFFFLELSGATVGALGLAFGVTGEAVASRVMAHKTVAAFSKNARTSSGDIALSYRYIMKFYYPLALTSVLALGVQPLVTFFLGKSRMSLESLAVLPVISSLVFIFRSLGLSYQEVGIALMGKHNENYHSLKNFAAILGVAAVTILAIITILPLSILWFHEVSGLSLELTLFARLPAQILTILPGLTVLISFQRAILVNNKKTTPVTLATSIEVVTIFFILVITTKELGLVGAVGAALALLTGRLLANGYLFHACRQALKTSA